jgi:hypothetical protein
MKIGSITGHATLPTTNTTGVQRDLSGGGGHTLQKAYDGLAGSGSGKNILVADEAVHLTQENNSTADADIFHAALRITKDADKSAFGLTGDIEEQERGIDIKTRYTCKGAVVHRVNLQDLSGNGYLSAEETISIDAAGDRIRFTRVGVDLTFTGANADLAVSMDLVEITGSTLGNNGIYFINTVVDADELDLLDVFASTASLVQETSNPALKASIYREVFIVGKNYDELLFNTLGDFQNDGNDDGAAIDINIPSGADDTYKVIDIHRLPSTDFLLYNNLDLDSDGTIKSNHINVAIEATAGDVKANQNVTATNGLVRAILGDVTAGNDVIANQDVIATNGDVEAQNGDVVADVNVTATAGDVTATAGDVVATAGDVIAGDDVIATNDFEYSVAREFTTAINIEHAIVLSGGWVYSSDLIGNGNWEHLGAANDNPIRFPFMLPNGATLKKVEFLVDKADTSNMTLRVWRNDVDWTTPSNLSTPSQIGSTQTISSPSGAQILDSGTLTHTMSSSIDRYYAEIRSYSSATDNIHGMRVTFELTRYRPMGSP